MDNKTYYLFLDNQQKGPYSKENLQVMYRAGKIDEYAQGRTEDLGEWVELRGYSDIVGMVATKKVHPSVSSHGRATRKFHDLVPCKGTTLLSSNLKAAMDLLPVHWYVPSSVFCCAPLSLV